jgi:hypothetical protein
VPGLSFQLVDQTITKPSDVRSRRGIVKSLSLYSLIDGGIRRFFVPTGPPWWAKRGWTLHIWLPHISDMLVAVTMVALCLEYIEHPRLCIGRSVPSCTYSAFHIAPLTVTGPVGIHYDSVSDSTPSAQPPIWLWQIDLSGTCHSHPIYRF